MERWISDGEKRGRRGGGEGERCGRVGGKGREQVRVSRPFSPPFSDIPRLRAGGCGLCARSARKKTRELKPKWALVGFWNCGPVGL